MTANITEQLNIYQSRFDNASLRVRNNSAVIQSIDKRYDSECMELNDRFLKSAKDDKLKFYFKRKFQRKPRVLILYRAVRLDLQSKEAEAAWELKTTYSVSEDNIFLDYFRYSILMTDKPNIESVVKSIEVCYIAFEEMRYSKV